MSGTDRDRAERVMELFEELRDRAEASGYHLNPDREFTLDLVEGLVVNEARFGYGACPCRLAEGDRAKDLDIICPCDYRDPDLTDWGSCYCGLYVSEDVLSGEREVRPVPERRPPEEERGTKGRTEPSSRLGSGAGVPVWRCRVCGYLCAREGPPEVCPICKAARDRFERF